MKTRFFKILYYAIFTILIFSICCIDSEIGNFFAIISIISVVILSFVAYANDLFWSIEEDEDELDERK